MEWTQNRMDLQRNGLKSGMDLKWTGLKMEWTQNRMDLKWSGLKMDWT